MIAEKEENNDMWKSERTVVFDQCRVHGESCGEGELACGMDWEIWKEVGVWHTVAVAGHGFERRGMLFFGYE